jgi:tetratricopeptide (TPR) repeat protein
VPILRLTDFLVAPNQHRVEVALEGEGLVRRTVTREFTFALSPQDRERLRWYLEDYLLTPFDPAPLIAARVEDRIAEIGAELFQHLFGGDRDAMLLWGTVLDGLSDTRVEVSTEVGAAGIPWELIRDPTTEAMLALGSRSFVRTLTTPAQPPRLPLVGAGPVRILLVVSRPARGKDVPFRSVAKHIVGKLIGVYERFELNVLRPATIGQLDRELREAHAGDRPYHVVHFDGHGTYQDPRQPFAIPGQHVFTDRRAGQHGYLAFEAPNSIENTELVSGPQLGRLLVETGVSVLVLNACRSAHSEPLEAPEPVESDVEPVTRDLHEQVRAYGSFALEAMDAGLAGVVAMGYKVYVVTAAQFVSELYDAVARGRTLGEAGTRGRQHLRAEPRRQIQAADAPIELLDWLVPVLYEAAPLRLVPQKDAARPIRDDLRAEVAIPAHGTLDPRLPAAPDAGFFGRDETLLALDRRFDTQRVVLLHAYAGSGKSATAAEFARWYTQTRGVEGPVLFTSFERPRPLSRVLDDLEPFFGKTLEQRGIHWLALSDQERRENALELLRQIPVLWIWDNVEEVAGFPTPDQAILSLAEQKELADFLRAARDTKAKFLLTSRRDERPWLGDLPALIELPPMRMPERVGLAQSLAEKHGQQISDVSAWLTLLSYTEGNPLTLIVVVGQALRDGLQTEDEIHAFVDKLRAGEAALVDDEEEGRTRSLAASLTYGLAYAFSEDERKVLALLQFFQTVVNIDIFYHVLYPTEPHHWNLGCVEPQLRKMSKDELAHLCERAAEIGLLTHAGGYIFLIHPVLPWFLRRLFKRASSSTAREPLGHPSPNPAETYEICATRAYVEAIGGLGGFLGNELNRGDESIGRALRAEEQNFIRALSLAKRHGWWPNMIGPMLGLEALYEFTGAFSLWKKLVEDIIPLFVDGRNGGPLPDHEDEWSFVTSWRVELARKQDSWEEAKHLLQLLLDRERSKCMPLLSRPEGELSPEQVHAIKNLVIHENDLGLVLGEQNDPECLGQFNRAIELSAHIKDVEGQAHTLYNVAGALSTIDSIRNFDTADRYIVDAFNLTVDSNSHFRARCLGQRGFIALERYKAKMDSGATTPSDKQLVLDAINFYEAGLELLGEDSPVSDRLTFRNQLCNCFNHAARSDLAILHCQESIRLAEGSGEVVRAAYARGNLARALAQVGNFESALEYLKVAKRQLETYLGVNAPQVQTAQSMLDQIRKRMSELSNQTDSDVGYSVVNG